MSGNWVLITWFVSILTHHKTVIITQVSENKMMKTWQSYINKLCTIINMMYFTVFKRIETYF